MLDVKIEKILPVTEARDSFNKLVDEVESSDELYVLTKNGKPAAVLVGVHHLEKLTGKNEEELMDQTSQGAGTDDTNVTPVTDANVTPTTITDSTVGETVETETETPGTSEEPKAEITPDTTMASTPSATSEPSETPVSSTAETTMPGEESQQSGATASPFENKPAEPVSSNSTPPAEDPLDFLSDSSDPIPATTPEPASETTTTMGNPAAMAGTDAPAMQAPASMPNPTPASGPAPMPGTPETPANPAMPQQQQ